MFTCTNLILLENLTYDTLLLMKISWSTVATFMHMIVNFEQFDIHTYFHF